MVGSSVENQRPRRGRCDRGAAAIEFALLTPFLLLIVFGIVEFGRGYNAQITLTHAAREGVRVMALGTDDPVSVATDAAGSLSVSVSTSGGPCTNPANAGDPVSVTVSRTQTYTIPFFGSGSWDMAETATMRCGG